METTLPEFVVITLATWRLAKMVVQEAGPWQVFARFRHLIGVRYDKESRPYSLNPMAEAVACLWCFSVWCGLFFALFVEKGVYILPVGLAASAGGILLDSLINKLEE